MSIFTNALAKCTGVETKGKKCFSLRFKLIKGIYSY